MTRVALALFVALLVFAGPATALGAQPVARSAAATPASTPAPADSASTGAAAGAVDQADTTIDATASVELTPADPGTVRVTLGFDVPTQVTDLAVTLPDEARVASTDGFQRGSDGYEWTGAGDPSVTYALDVNRSDRAEGPLTGDGQYSFVDAGPWALVRKPGFGARWEWRGSPDVTLDRSVEPAGAGAVGDSMLYLGPHTEHVRQAHGQRFRLIVPAAAELAVPPDAVLASLSNASDELRVGDRDDAVFGVAAPTATVGWTARGLQTGDTDFWVRDQEVLTTPENVWLHEYVHTRQSFPDATDSSARWLTEGMANYYAALLTLEDGDTGFTPFSRELARGSGGAYDDSILAAPDTWARYTDYEKGALVAGELDRQIRLATGGVNSFENVWAQLNGAEEPVDQPALREAIRTVTNESTADRLAPLTTTRSTPEMWSRADHRAAFGPTPALFRTTVPAPETSYRIAGPYRNRSTERVPTLVPGETVAFDVRVENVGGESGEYAIPIRRDGTTIRTLSGTADGRTVTNETVEYTVTEPGRWTLAVGDSTLVLTARSPATPTVTEIATDPASPTAESSVTLTATVRNDASVPARTTLRFAVDGTPLANRTVRLDADSTREITVSTTLAAGSHRITVGNTSTTVDVAEPTPTETARGAGGAGSPASGTTTGSGPGFAVLGTLAALALGALALARRDRRD